MNQLSKDVLIRNRLGLHARAAVKLVELAQSFDAQIMLTKNEQTVTADSVMGILLLDSSQGEQIKVSAEGSEAQQAFDAITALIEAGFDEEN
ncbi:MULTISPECIES: HPr family phosphocarrier protein [Grimontia]|uniref:Phosphocarrier protein NPr n=1 Tax=Grimontia marina TaxID=646534 RepID=A0A128EWI0_9GAMM|nr:MULTISPECIES: HPr family phosphocarrier protein [Grimontia]WRV97017.1 HPr family phosphocarrier protein [Grimontia sp. NTOU-MAR1]CZF78376.1 Phosphocarrier protein NPr [Grimontia marina]